MGSRGAHSSQMGTVWAVSRRSEQTKFDGLHSGKLQLAL